MASPLQSSVTTLQSSLHLLTSSISILDSSVADFPRLAKVLQTTRAHEQQHFELLPEPTLHAAQAALLSEITPQVDFLLTRVSTHLDKLERREKALVAKAELQEGRLQGRGASPTGDKGRGEGGRGEGIVGEGRREGEGEGGRGGDGLEELRVKAVRQRKERLSYAVERLTLQAQQRERQLRMSVARGE